MNDSDSDNDGIGDVLNYSMDWIQQMLQMQVMIQMVMASQMVMRSLKVKLDSADSDGEVNDQEELQEQIQ